MNVQGIARIFGWIFILVGVVGLVYSYTMDEALMLGLFPVNVVHNLAHILLGVWGIMAARTFAGARTFALVGGAAYLLLAIIGYVEPNPGDMLPLGGNDVWLHAVLAIVLLLVGLTAKARARV